ncbi:hypothetical protein COCNU_01G010440 [Cocos nucifera]|uniref:Protein kinase domain-containing protein n=1 Tax=Cocos nucifera TaxID=13894 RepID=A0A8K0HVW1_COCNU|nr:hypothetical protein COCNU_01G010440 [Cocos nucifera]
MARFILPLFILVQLPWSLVCGSVPTLSKVCRFDHVAYSKSSDGYHLSINQERIEDPVLICEALETYFKSGCLLCDSQVESWRRIGKEYCRQDFNVPVNVKSNPISVDLVRRAGRKLLLQFSANASNLDRLTREGQLQEEELDIKYSSPSDNVPLAVPGIFLICCGFMCPCFHPRKKERSEHNVLARQLNSMDLVRRAGRKLLLQFSANASNLDRLTREGQLQEEELDIKYSSPSDNVPLAVPGIFLICCGFMCPCFHPRKKERSEHNVLARQLNSMDSVSSIELSSASEKIPTTPLRVPPSPSRFSLSPQLSTIGSVNLSISQIIKATQSFSPSLRLGEGGFGTVYKAVLPDGLVVAIKRAKKEHIPALRDEFSNEVELLAKIEHRNLVRLLGYTDKGNERIIITEYVPNGTLREHLDGQHGKILDFKQRLEIAIDVAHALTYLHLYAGLGNLGKKGACHET